MTSGRGVFIVLEGLDGAGTTTQLDRLAAALRAEGRTVLVTREPSEGPVGVWIRQALAHRFVRPKGEPIDHATLALLFAADRTDHLASAVEPALERGEVVLCDRYLLSSIAYQGANLPVAWVEEINGRARSPDLTLFVEVDVRTAGKRRAARGGDAQMFENDAEQRRIAKAYRAAIARRARKDRIRVIDGAQPVEEVTRSALAEIRKVLGRKKGTGYFWAGAKK
jgi:dTMP kinase